MLAIKEIWKELAANYTADKILIEDLWSEIEANYSFNRPYHNLFHLEFIFNELDKCRDLIENFNQVAFSVFYHDIIYHSDQRNNEEKSAELARESLRKLGLDKSFIQSCYSMILATKNHKRNMDKDTNYFLDADMAILGVEQSQYQEYSKKVRTEYLEFPDIKYNSGRKKLLNKFIDLPRIFQTDYFYDKYEAQARSNIKMEIAQLNQL